MSLRELLKEYSVGEIALAIAQMIIAGIIIYAYIVLLLAF